MNPENKEQEDSKVLSKLNNLIAKELGISVQDAFIIKKTFCNAIAQILDEMQPDEKLRTKFGTFTKAIRKPQYYPVFDKATKTYTKVLSKERKIIRFKLSSSIKSIK